MRAGERGLSSETLLSAILSDPNGEKFKGQNTNSTDEKITGGEDENHISTDANHKLPGVSVCNDYLLNQANAGHVTTQTPRMERPGGDISAFRQSFRDAGRKEKSRSGWMETRAGGRGGE